MRCQFKLDGDGKLKLTFGATLIRKNWQIKLAPRRDTSLQFNHHSVACSGVITRLLSKSPQVCSDVEKRRRQTVLEMDHHQEQ